MIKTAAIVYLGQIKLTNNCRIQAVQLNKWFDDSHTTVSAVSVRLWQDLVWWRVWHRARFTPRARRGDERANGRRRARRGRRRARRCGERRISDFYEYSLIYIFISL